MLTNSNYLTNHSLLRKHIILEMKKIFLPFLCLTVLFTNAQSPRLIIGTYDSPTSEGIYVYSFNQADGSAKELSHVKTSNPSFMAVSPNKKYVYAVNENADKNGRGGGVSSFAFDKKTGTLSFLNQQSSEGNHPCYITADNTGKWIIAGNYSSGNFAILPVNDNGLLGKATQVIQHKGSGPDTARQKSAHVHTTVLSKDNKNLYVTDLGTDKIMRYDFNEKTGRVNPSLQKFIAVGAGTGPRHIDISNKGKYIYLLQELTGTLSVFSKIKNEFKIVQTVSTLPGLYTGAAGSADIHITPDGKFLYASNRGLSNSIAIFSICKSNGELKLITHQSTLGLNPRNFNLDPSGKFLLVGNQNSDEVVIFKRDIYTGLLTDTGNRINIGKPVCIKWL